MLHFIPKNPQAASFFVCFFPAMPSDHRSKTCNGLTYKDLPGDLNSIFRPKSGLRTPPPTSPVAPIQPGTSRDGGSGTGKIYVFLSGVMQKGQEGCAYFPSVQKETRNFLLDSSGRKMVQCQSIFQMSGFSSFFPLQTRHLQRKYI